MFFMRGESLKDLHLDYHRELDEREDDVKIEQFKESASYSTYGRTIRVIRRSNTMMTIVYEGEMMDVPIYRWIDDSESTVIIDMKTREKHPIMSIPVIESGLGRAIRGLHESMRFEQPDVDYEDE